MIRISINILLGVFSFSYKPSNKSSRRIVRQIASHSIHFCHGISQNYHEAFVMEEEMQKPRWYTHKVSGRSGIVKDFCKYISQCHDQRNQSCKLQPYLHIDVTACSLSLIKLQKEEKKLSHSGIREVTIETSTQSFWRHLTSICKWFWYVTVSQGEGGGDGVVKYLTLWYFIFEEKIKIKLFLIQKFKQSYHIWFSIYLITVSESHVEVTKVINHI